MEESNEKYALRQNIWDRKEHAKLLLDCIFAASQNPKCLLRPEDMNKVYTYASELNHLITEICAETHELWNAGKKQ